MSTRLNVSFSASLRHRDGADIGALVRSYLDNLQKDADALQELCHNIDVFAKMYDKSRTNFAPLPTFFIQKIHERRAQLRSDAQFHIDWMPNFATIRHMMLEDAREALDREEQAGEEQAGEERVIEIFTCYTIC